MDLNELAQQISADLTKTVAAHDRPLASDRNSGNADQSEV